MPHRRMGGVGRSSILEHHQLAVGKPFYVSETIHLYVPIRTVHWYDHPRLQGCREGAQVLRRRVTARVNIGDGSPA